MTPFIKKKDLKNDWYIINAENAVVGRLAAYISRVLRGKNKATFNRHMDNGDFVIVTNIEKMKFTGKKYTNKIYYRHTGHPGGIKETTPLRLAEKNKTEEILKLADLYTATGDWLILAAKSEIPKKNDDTNIGRTG